MQFDHLWLAGASTKYASSNNDRFTKGMVRADVHLVWILQKWIENLFAVQCNLQFHSNFFSFLLETKSARVLRSTEPPLRMMCAHREDSSTQFQREWTDFKWKIENVLSLMKDAWSFTNFSPPPLGRAHYYVQINQYYCHAWINLVAAELTCMP